MKEKKRGEKIKKIRSSIQKKKSGWEPDESILCYDNVLSLVME